MQQLFYVFLATFSIGSIYGQNCDIKTGYAYQRGTIPGNFPRKSLDETGKQVEAPVKLMNTYFIYVEVKKDCGLQVSKIWIDGKAYHAAQEEIMNTPVIIQHQHPGTAPDTLVRRTDKKLFSIQPTQEWEQKPGKKIMNNYTGAKIVIEYVRQSRTNHFKIRDIKRIAPVVLQ